MRLSDTERVRATALNRSLRAAQAVIASGERDPSVATGAALQVLSAAAIQPDYFELVDPETFVPIQTLSGNLLAVVAASLEGARLIDNLPMEVPEARQQGTPTPGKEARGSHNANAAASERASEQLARPAA